MERGSHLMKMEQYVMQEIATKAKRSIFYTVNIYKKHATLHNHVGHIIIKNYIRILRILIIYFS